MAGVAAAAPPKLRFVRCPECLQILVEHASIPVYECGGCGKVLKAKYRAVAAENTDSESVQDNGSLNHKDAVTEKTESIHSEQIVTSSSSCENQVTVQSTDPTPVEDDSSLNRSEDFSEKTSSIFSEEQKMMNTQFSGESAREASCFTVKNCEAVENVHVNEEKSTTESKQDEGCEAQSNENDLREMEDEKEQNDTFTTENGGFPKVPTDDKQGEIFEINCNHGLIEEVEKQHQIKSLRADSHGNLIEELERSLEFEAEEDYADKEENNDLDNAIHSPVRNTNEAFRGDPHGLLIEELERSLNEAEEVSHGNSIGLNVDIAKDLQSSVTISKLTDESVSSPPRESTASDDDIADTAQGNGLEKGLQPPATRSLNPSDGSVSSPHRPSTPSEEDTVDKVDGDGLDNRLRSPATKSNGGVSAPECGGNSDACHQYITKSRTFQQRALATDVCEEKVGGYYSHNRDHKMTAVLSNMSNSSNEKFHSTLPSFDKTNNGLPWKYDATELRQGLSLDSQDFQSIQNFLESQMDGSSSSLSGGSPVQEDLTCTSNKFKNFDRTDRLKKMEKLRDQLSRLSNRQRGDEQYQHRGIDHQPPRNHYNPSEVVPRSVHSTSNASCYTVGTYHGQTKVPRYPPSPFTPHCSCLHCSFRHQQPHLYNCSAVEYNSYYQSSYDGSLPAFDNESLKSSLKEKKQLVRKKHILRPLSGAAPFIICGHCFRLLQVPSDIDISRKKLPKLQCSYCSKVLMLPIPAVSCLDEKNPKEVSDKPNEEKIEVICEGAATSHSVELQKEDEICISEDRGVSLTRNFSNGAESMLPVSIDEKKISESALHLLMGYNSATELLRQSRVLDDGYESFESMVPVSYRLSKRKGT